MQWRIYLVRHAHAGDPKTWAGDDAKRPLSAKGRDQADRLAAFLRNAGLQPRAVISSPKARAQQTAEVLASALGATVTIDDRVASDFDVTALVAVVDPLDGGDVMVVGHDPDFSELLATLIAARQLPMPKGALARVDIDGTPTAGGGTLRWFVPPQALKASD